MMCDLYTMTLLDIISVKLREHDSHLHRFHIYRSVYVHISCCCVLNWLIGAIYLPVTTVGCSWVTELIYNVRRHLLTGSMMLFASDTIFLIRHSQRCVSTGESTCGNLVWSDPLRKPVVQCNEKFVYLFLCFIWNGHRLLWSDFEVHSDVFQHDYMYCIRFPTCHSALVKLSELIRWTWHEQQ